MPVTHINDSSLQFTFTQMMRKPRDQWTVSRGQQYKDKRNIPIRDKRNIPIRLKSYVFHSDLSNKASCTLNKIHLPGLSKDKRQKQKNRRKENSNFSPFDYLPWPLTVCHYKREG